MKYDLYDGLVGFCYLTFLFSIMFCHFTDVKHQHDPDDDSGVGPSISTDTKTIFSEVSFYLP